MRQGKQSIEQRDINSAFYRSSRGNMSTSIGMQGVLNQGNYGYVSKSRQMSQRSRLQSAGNSSRRSNIFSQRKALGATLNEDPRDAVSYASRNSALSASRPEQIGLTYPRRLTSAYNSMNQVPQKQERFNEEIETRSNLSRKARETKTQSLMSTKNLAKFTKARPSLKVIGTPNMQSTSQAPSQASGKKSIFS